MNMIDQVSRFTRKNSPEILAGLAAAGVIGTTILAVRATAKAVIYLDEAGFKKEEPAPAHLTPQETIAVCWKLYIPTALSAAGTIACIIGSSRIGHRRNAALVAGMAFADRAFSEYKDEVRELLGERKETEIREKIAQKRLEANSGDGQVIMTGDDDVVCYDTYTDRYFRSDAETIRRAVNDVNHAVIHDLFASQNSFYSLIGLEDCLAGEEVGWNLDHLLEIIFTSHIRPKDGKPCLAISYVHLPIPKYANLH